MQRSNPPAKDIAPLRASRIDILLLAFAQLLDGVLRNVRPGKSAVAKRTEPAAEQPERPSRRERSEDLEQASGYPSRPFGEIVTLVCDGLDWDAWASQFWAREKTQAHGSVGAVRGASPRRRWILLPTTAHPGVGRDPGWRSHLRWPGRGNH